MATRRHDPYLLLRSRHEVQVMQGRVPLTEAGYGSQLCAGNRIRRQVLEYVCRG